MNKQQIPVSTLLFKKLALVFVWLLTITWAYGQENKDDAYFDQFPVEFAELTQIGIGTGYINQESAYNFHLSKYWQGERILFGFKTEIQAQFEESDIYNTESLSIMIGGNQYQNNWYLQYNTGVSFIYTSEQFSSVYIGLPIDFQLFYMITDDFGIGLNCFINFSTTNISRGASIALRFDLGDQIPYLFF